MIRIAVLDENDVCQYIVNEFDENLQSAEDYGGNIVKIEADVELRNILNKKYNGKSFIKNESELTIMEAMAAQDSVNADALLSQAEQTAKLNSIDETLAVILLNSTGGAL